MPLDKELIKIARSSNPSVNDNSQAQLLATILLVEEQRTANLLKLLEISPHPHIDEVSLRDLAQSITRRLDL